MPSQRETRIAGSTQRWRGVDQRTQPTLVQEGFFIMARGTYFGLGDNVERLPGKKLSGVLPGPVFQMTVLGDIVILQSFDKLYTVPLSELLTFTI